MNDELKRRIRFNKSVFIGAIVGAVVTRPLFGLPTTPAHWIIWIVVMLVISSVGAALVGTFLDN